MVRRALAIVVLVAISVHAAPAVAAKVANISLAELVQHAEFIGTVRVDRISRRIPLVRRPRATATILESWKGQRGGRVVFVAAPTWICDISDAEKGEETIVFVRDGSLLHSGRGRMPVFTRDGRRLAAIWPEVRLPAGVATEDGPEVEYRFIRAVDVGALRDAVAKVAIGHDPQAERRKVSALLAEEGSEDGQASKSWHVRHTRSGNETRTRGAVLQTR